MKRHEPPNANANAATPPDQPDAATHEPGELERLRQELQAAKDQYVRAVAEFENTKKRLHRETEEFAKYAAEGVIRALLPIIDSLDQALIAVDKQSDPEAVIKGVHLIYRQLLGLLEREGVKRIPSVGAPFDPHQHEAVAQVEAGNGAADDHVAEEVQVGYTMHGKVLRPAMVKVAKTSPEQHEKP
jgi:molecular chaperone GrpE